MGRLPTGRSSSTEREVSFIGREQELARLLALGVRAREGDGQFVLLGGETGIGKSRLAEEALRRFEADGFAVLRARCVPEAPTPYLPLFEALKSGGLPHLLSLERPPRLEYLYLSSPSGVEMVSTGRASSRLDRDLFLAMLSALESFVNDSLSTLDGSGPGRGLNAIGYGEWRIIILSRPFGNLIAVIRGTESQALVEALEAALDTIEREHAPLIAQWDGNRTAAAALGRHLQEVLSSGQFDGEEEAVDPKDRKYRVLEGLSRGLHRVSTRRPIALYFDDAHLADSATVGALQYLARSNRSSALIVLATFQRGDSEGTAGPTSPFSAACASMIEDRLAEEVLLGPLDQTGFRRLIEEQLGVKRLDPELVTALYRETHGAPLFTLEILRALNAEGHLQRIGGSVYLKGGSEVEALPTQLREAVRRRIARLAREERDILECAAVDGEVFVPARVAEALDLKPISVMRVLRTLEEEHHLVLLREDMAHFEHEKTREVIYEGIHPELRRQYHLAVADCCVREMEATGKDLTEAAAHHFARARSARGRAYILKAAERARAASSNLEAAEWYGAYVALNPRDVDVKVLDALADALLYGGKYEQAEKLYERLVKNSTSDEERLPRLRNLAEASSSREGWERATGWFDRYRPPGEGLAWARWAVFRARFALRVGAVDRAETDVTKALPILLNQGGSKFDIAEAYSALSFIGEAVGDYDLCIVNGKKAIEMADETFPMLAVYYNNAGVGCLFRGKFDESGRYLRRGLEIAEAKTDATGLTLISNNLGLLDIRRGEFRSARDHLLRALKWAERIESPFMTGMALDFLGLCSIEEGRFDDAAEFLQRAVPVTERAGDKGQLIRLRIHLAMLEIERGDPTYALEQAERAYTLAANSGAAPEQAMARGIMGRIYAAEGDSEKAAKAFTEAARGLQFSPAQFEYAETLHYWGVFLVDIDSGGEAAKKLAASAQVFASMGANERVRRTARLLQLARAGPADEPRQAV